MVPGRTEEGLSNRKQGSGWLLSLGQTPRQCLLLGFKSGHSRPEASKLGLWHSSQANTQAQFLGLLEGVSVSSPGPGEMDPSVSLSGPGILPIYLTDGEKRSSERWSNLSKVTQQTKGRGRIQKQTLS